MGGRLLASVTALVLSSLPLAVAGQDPAAALAASHKRVAQARDRGYWEVRPGDHVFRIARLFAADEVETVRLAQELKDNNPNAFIYGDPGKLVVGAKLRLPDRYLASGVARAPEKPSPAAVAPPASPAPAPVSSPPVASPGSPAPVSSPPVASSGTAARAPAAAVSPPATATPTASAAQPPARPAGGERAVPFEVSVNSAKAGTWLLLERGGELYAPRDAFEEWRIQLDENAKPVEFRGVKYWPLSSVPGFKSRIDFANQSVDLLFSPQAFSAVRLTTEPSKRLAPSPVLPSVFLNYDFNYNGSRLRDAPNLNDLGVIAEVGVSSSWGVLTSTQVGRNLTGESALGQPRSFLRLDTTLTRDFPDRNLTLRVGDTTTRAGIWGRNVYFGGVQYGTNFALTPGFITQPLPTLLGTSTAPSTVELYVNDVLRQVSSVPTGPFAIDNFPLMTGSGEARLVVRDLLGRETVIVQPFFASNRLLAKGLSDWTVETGTVRENYGNSSNDYGAGFGAGTWRYGYSNELTLEGRTELSRRVKTLGLGFSAALPWQLLGSAAFVASDLQDVGRGGLWVLTLEREQPRSSLAFQAKGASSKFHVLGQDAEVNPFKLQLAGNWTYYSENLGTLGLGFATITGFDNLDISTVSGNYSINVGRYGSVTFTASRAIAGASGTALGLNFIVPLEGSRIASASATRRDKRNDTYVTASQNPSAETDLGWRVLAGQVQDQGRAEGGLFYRGRYGTLNAEGSASKDQSSVRLGTTGGLVLADGNLFLTRRIDQGFALAEVKGYGNVGIGLGSNMLTRTDSKGVALIPDLWPYTPNSIRLNPNELPINAQVESIEQVVVPSWRSGVKVTFPVRGGRGALLRIVLEDGDVAPPGAIVQIEGDAVEHYVARRGESFVTGLEPGSRVLLKWKNRQCALDVVLPPEKPEEFPRIGPLLCKGVIR